MALRGQQHLGEAAGDMGTDGLAFIGPDHRPQRPLVGGNAEMVRPEPRQPFGKADVRGERGIEPCPRLAQEDLLRHRRHAVDPRPPWPGLERRRHRRVARHVVTGHVTVGGGRRRSARNRRGIAAGPRGPRHIRFSAGREALGAALFAEHEGRARSLGAGREIGSGNLGGPRPRDIGDQRAARIAAHRGKRTCSWTETETVQGEHGLRRCIRTGICRHGVISDAPARWREESERSVSRKRRNALGTFI